MYHGENNEKGHICPVQKEMLQSFHGQVIFDLHCIEKQLEGFKTCSFGTIASVIYLIQLIVAIVPCEHLH